MASERQADVATIFDVHLEFGRRAGRTRLGQTLDIGLQVLGVIIILLGLIDLSLGALIAAACGGIGGILVACAGAVVFDPDPIRAIYVGMETEEVDTPPAPKGAAVLHPDGTRSGLEWVFIGRDGNGMAMFRATMPVNLTAGDQIVVDELPPNTGIVAGWYEKPS